jgi:high-affinity K+ transport system ATPase subunit B
MLDPEDRGAGDRLGLRQARSAALIRNPVMFVVEVVAALTT